MFRIEYRVSLILRQDLPYPGVRLRVFIVRELVVSGRNEGRFERSISLYKLELFVVEYYFEYSIPFYKLEFFIIVNGDYSDLEVYPFPLLSSDP